MMVPLKMVAASSYIPKNTDEYPLGQDALFIHPATQTIGVADGVGGWNKYGIDAGEYARQLITNCTTALRKFKSTGSGCHVNPKRIIKKAYLRTTKPGSSTACVVALSGDNLLRAANVGDSGFLVIRGGAVSYRSPIQQTRFNAPFQLGATANDPRVAKEIEFRAEKGDIVVLGTDGLLDNVHAAEILEIVCQGVEERKDVADLCSCLANRAYENSFSETKDTPFSIKARKAWKTSWRGGKKDDISVIVAMIEEKGRRRRLQSRRRRRRLSLLLKKTIH